MFGEFFRFIYPTRCLYCDEELEKVQGYLCKKCIGTLKLAHHSKSDKEAYCFEYVSPAKALLKRYEATYSQKLGQLIVSWMIVKFTQMGWEMPDLIISGVKEEIAFYKKSILNKNLAILFAKMLGASYLDLFTYSIPDQVYDERGVLQGYVQLKKNISLERKKILIIQDHVTPLMKEYYNLLAKYENCYGLAFLSEEKEEF